MIKTYKEKIQIVPQINSPKWLKRMVRLDIDRLSLLNVIGLLELVLRHPALPDATREKAVKTGRTFASCLLDDGLIIPDRVRESWESTFNMKIEPERDRIIPGLTDQEGRPWK